MKSKKTKFRNFGIIGIVDTIDEDGDGTISAFRKTAEGDYIWVGMALSEVRYDEIVTGPKGVKYAIIYKDA